MVNNKIYYSISMLYFIRARIFARGGQLYCSFLPAILQGLIASTHRTAHRSRFMHENQVANKICINFFLLFKGHA